MSGLPPPPPGTNLADNKQSMILGVNISLFCLAAVVVVLRFIARRLSKAPFWWDDYLMIPALAFAGVVFFTSVCWMLPYGLGKHIWVADKDAIEVWAKALFIQELAYTLTICCVKFSLLTFYWRIFKMSSIRIPIYIVGGIITCWGIVVIIITIFQCTPVEGFWDKSINPTCNVDTGKFFDGNAVPNIVTDGVVLILPIPYIWGLQLPRAQKIALTSIFFLGAFVIGISITRIVYVVSLDLHSPDVTWNFVNGQVWSGLELHIGIICACLASLRPLLTYLLTGSAFDTANRSGKASGTRSSTSNSKWSNMMGSLAGRSSKMQSQDHDDVHPFNTLSDTEHGGSIRSHVDEDSPTKHPGIGLRDMRPRGNGLR